MACERANARGTGLRPGLDGRGGRLHMDPLAWTAEPAVSTGVVPGRQYFSALLGNPNSAAADADVLEAKGAETSGVEQVLGVDDDRTLQQVLDAIEVESAELGPSGAND